jgi:hypothetical protein
MTHLDTLEDSGKTQITVFIGYDRREYVDACLAANSIRRHASKKVMIIPLIKDELRCQGLYTRPFDFDKIATSDFSDTRFLVYPIMEHYFGEKAKNGNYVDRWALYMDSDMIFTDDVYKIIPHDREFSTKAVYVRKHEMEEGFTTKKGGRKAQVYYPRKNWSSFVLYKFGVNGEANSVLTLDAVNNWIMSFLHRFEWLQDEQIGELDDSWNHLVGINEEPADLPIVLHYTLGSPLYNPNTKYAEYWKSEYYLTFGKYWIPPAREVKLTKTQHNMELVRDFE